MKYRITTITKHNKLQIFVAEVKCFLRWRYLNSDGNEVDYWCFASSRQEALQRIDTHYGNSQCKINVEYITK